MQLPAPRMVPGLQVSAALAKLGAAAPITNPIAIVRTEPRSFILKGPMVQPFTQPSRHLCIIVLLRFIHLWLMGLFRSYVASRVLHRSPRKVSQLVPPPRRTIQ